MRWLRSRWLERGSAPLAISLAIAFYLWWEIGHRGTFGYTQSIYQIDDVDEWRYTACSTLVAHGYELFNQVFSAQPPLLFLSLAGGMRIAGGTIDGARWVEIVFGLVALLSVTTVAWLLAGRVAAAAAEVVLALSAGFLVYAHTVEAEVPMMAMATLSLVLVLCHDRLGRHWWLVLAGLSAAAAILLKLFAVEVVIPTLWIIASGGPNLRSSARPVFYYSAAVAAPLVLDFALVSPLHQWQQVIALHNQAAGLTFPTLASPAVILGRFLSLDLGLSILAAAALLALGLLGRWRQLIFLVLWLGGSIVMLFLFRPLFPHHPAILTAPLAVTASIGVALLAESLRIGNIKRAALPAIAVLVYILLLPRLAHADRHVLFEVPPPASLPLAVWIGKHSTPRDFVAADDLKFADVAGRLVPPPLCDPSDVRLHAGYLTMSDLIQATVQYRPVLVIPSRGTYAEVPGYLSWLRAHYRAVKAPGGVTAYSRR